MVTCHIDAAIPENRSVRERIARLALREIGTALYRAYLQHLIPEVRAMRAEIDAEAAQFPDLLERSSQLLRGILGEALDEMPAWARSLGFSDYFGIRHRRFRDQLADMLTDARSGLASTGALAKSPSALVATRTRPRNSPVVCRILC